MSETLSVSEPAFDPATGYYSDEFSETAVDKYLFEDYGGKQALSYYNGLRLSKSRKVLPPLWSVQVYVTFSNPPLEEIAKEIDVACSHAMMSCFSQRIDIYALEHASIQDCMGHYDAEKRSRENTARAIPSYDPHDTGDCGYLVFIESEDWRSAGVSLVGWDEGDEDDLNNPFVQKRVKIDAPAAQTVGEGGFLCEDEHENEHLGNLGDAIVTLWPLNGEDDDYWDAFLRGKEVWGDETYRRPRQVHCVKLW